MKIEKISRWLFSLVLLVLLIELPRYQPTGPKDKAPPFWTQVHTNFQNLWHRVSTLSPGQTVDHQKIQDVVSGSLTSSFTLIGIALAIVLVVGIGKGVYDGVHAYQSGFGAAVSGLFHILAESVPDFFWIFSLELFGFFLNRHGIMVYFVGAQDQFFTGTVVPAIILALVPTVLMSRLVRAAVEEQLGQQYLVTARAKGLSSRHVMWRHVMPNTLRGIALAFFPVMGLLLSNLAIIEYLFYRNGIMSGTVYAMGIIDGQDHPFDAPLILTYLIFALLLFAVSIGVLRGLLYFLGYRGKANPYTSSFRQSTSRKWNWQFWLGSSMLILLMALATLANHLPIPGPDHIDVIHYSGNDLSTVPFPPSADHLFGSDTWGRDMFSRALHDTWPTFGWTAIMVVAILLVASGLALLSSICRLRAVRYIIGLWHTFVTIVPGVIGALFILEIPTVAQLGFHALQENMTQVVSQSLDKPVYTAVWGPIHNMIFMAVVSFFVGGRVAHHLQAVLDDAQAKEYMDAAEISGNSMWTKFFLHHVRVFRSAVIEQGVVACSHVLLLTATLGFFGVEIGQAIQWNMAIGRFLPASMSHDWGSLFAENARDFMNSQWVMYAPALFVTWTVVALNFVQGGLRKWNAFEPASRKDRKPSLSYRMVAAVTARGRNKAGQNGLRMLPSRQDI